MDCSSTFVCRRHRRARISSTDRSQFVQWYSYFACMNAPASIDTGRNLSAPDNDNNNNNRDQNAVARRIWILASSTYQISMCNGLEMVQRQLYKWMLQRPTSKTNDGKVIDDGEWCNSLASQVAFDGVWCLYRCVTSAQSIIIVGWRWQKCGQANCAWALYLIRSLHFFHFNVRRSTFDVRHSTSDCQHARRFTMPVMSLTLWVFVSNEWIWSS